MHEILLRIAVAYAALTALVFAFHALRHRRLPGPAETAIALVAWPVWAVERLLYGGTEPVLRLAKAAGVGAVVLVSYIAGGTLVVWPLYEHLEGAHDWLGRGVMLGWAWVCVTIALAIFARKPGSDADVA